MPITIETIHEFQRIVYAVHGQALSFIEAKEILKTLVVYFDTLGKIKFREINRENDKSKI